MAIPVTTQATTATLSDNHWPETKNWRNNTKHTHNNGLDTVKRKCLVNNDAELMAYYPVIPIPEPVGTRL